MQPEAKAASRMEQEMKADVLVRVYSPSRDAGPLFALSFHSHVLCARSSFFAARSAALPLFSTTRDTPQDGEADAELFAIDIVVHHPNAASAYERCINLMYVRREVMLARCPFSGVHDALCMLCIATELLFQDGMDACMEYLTRLSSWTPEEDAFISSTLSSLQLAHIHPDLARRLSLPKGMLINEPTLILRRMLVHVLQASTQSQEALDPLKPIPESSILLAWNKHLDVFRKRVIDNHPTRFETVDAAVKQLLWLFDKLVALRAADAVVRALAEDTGLSSALTRFYISNEKLVFHPPGTVRMHDLPRGRMYDLLARMMQSVVKNEVLLSQAARMALTKTWLPLCDTRFAGFLSDTSLIGGFSGELVTSLMSLVDSSPVLEREQFYKEICMDPKLPEDYGSYCYGKKGLISSFSPWCQLLRDEANLLGGECSIVLVDDDAS